MDFNDIEMAIKVIIVGNGGVGKSSMITQFVHGQYDDNYKKTIGAAFMEKEHYVKRIGESVKFMLWDTAGQDEFLSLTRRYYRGAGACVLAFSTTDRASFQAIERWNQKVKEECGDICTVLIQNKIDLIDQAVVDQQEAEDLARRLKVNFFRTSVKKNFNVSAVFDALAEQYVEMHGSGGGLDLDTGIDLDVAPTMSITDTHKPLETPSVASSLRETSPTNTTTANNPTTTQTKDNSPTNTTTTQNDKGAHFQLHDPDDDTSAKKKRKFSLCKIL